MDGESILGDWSSIAQRRISDLNHQFHGDVSRSAEAVQFLERLSCDVNVAHCSGGLVAPDTLQADVNKEKKILQLELQEWIAHLWLSVLRHHSDKVPFCDDDAALPTVLHQLHTSVVTVKSSSRCHGFRLRLLALFPPTLAPRGRFKLDAIRQQNSARLERIVQLQMLDDLLKLEYKALVDQQQGAVAHHQATRAWLEPWSMARMALLQALQEREVSGATMTRQGAGSSREFEKDIGSVTQTALGVLNSQIKNGQQRIIDAYCGRRSDSVSSSARNEVEEGMRLLNELWKIGVSSKFVKEV